MSQKDMRDQAYNPTEWEDRVVDEATGDVLVEGTPVNEVNLNNLETGVMRALYDLGLANAETMTLARDLALELDKYKRQRVLQGQDTISGANNNGYFRDADPYVLVSISPDDYPQLNAPDYDVQLSVLDASDFGAVGELIVYDKTQNGFKVRMTGSAEEVTFMWTLLNPRIR